ncbi:hypothetical protein MAR_008316 [Mya arenaria]|uniref:Uncharacterized protein n=1 Tax=Mya arenaria TaxID=6604 RepID=A0ABY7DVN2_MYAAR|nr:hypothetical protein MAR_008316 [Mya arenaria]
MARASKKTMGTLATSALRETLTLNGQMHFLKLNLHFMNKVCLTISKDSTLCKKDEEATPTDNKKVIIAVSIAVPFAVILGVVVCVVMYKAFNKKKIAVTMSTDIDLFDEPANKHYHLREIPVSILGGHDKPLADSKPFDSDDTRAGPSTENHLQNMFNTFPDIEENNSKTAYSGFYGRDDVEQSQPGSSVVISDLK